MANVIDIIGSGLLEGYVLGLISAEEKVLVEEQAAINPAVQKAIGVFSVTLEVQARRDAIKPPLTLKPMVLATLDYMQRLTSGEPVSFPPLLNDQSTVDDYAPWLNRPDMIVKENLQGIHVKLIGHTPEMTTAVVWIRYMAPDEVHDAEHERFLIVEGTCDITIGNTVHSLVPGDYLSIPLYTNHHVNVTSANPCKVILQRIAA